MSGGSRHRRPEAQRRRFPRRAVLGAGAAGGALLGAACSAPDGGRDAAGPPAGAGGVVQLQKMAWGSPLEKEAIEQGLELFHAQQPGVRVEYLHQPDAYDDKLQALLAAGTAPDVFKVAGNLYADYIVAGALQDITDRLKRDDLLGRPDYFIQPFEQERSTYRGKWYGIGSTAQERVLFYNTEVLKQAGVPPPPVDPEKAWGWSEFLQLARRLTVRSGDVADRLGAHWPTAEYGPAVVSNGGKILDPRTLRFALDQPEASEAVQRVADLTLKDRVAATAAEQQGGTDLQRLASGRYAMWVSGNWQLLDLAPLGFAYGAGALPKLKRPATTMASSTTSIGRETKQRDAAWLLFRFLNTDDYQLPLVRKGLWNPSHTSLLSAAGLKRWLDPKVHPEGYERLVTELMVKYGYADIPAVGIRKASVVLNEGLAQIWTGQAAAQDVLKDTVARANKVLDEEQARVGT
jgi:multiple sugar transport system substrate-binding protein